MPFPQFPYEIRNCKVESEVPECNYQHTEIVDIPAHYNAKNGAWEKQDSDRANAVWKLDHKHAQRPKDAGYKQRKKRACFVHVFTKLHFSRMPLIILGEKSR